MSAPQFTPGPWHVCGEGKCSCFTVMCNDHPVAEVTHGDWGDDYPAIRIVGSSTIDGKAEAYMEQFTYGSIDDSCARANWHLIAAAPDLYAALIETLEIATRNEDGEWAIRARAALSKANPVSARGSTSNAEQAAEAALLPASVAAHPDSLPPQTLSQQATDRPDAPQPHPASGQPFTGA